MEAAVYGGKSKFLVAAGKDREEVESFSESRDYRNENKDLMDKRFIADSLRRYRENHLYDF